MELSEFLLARIADDEERARTMAQIVGGVDALPSWVGPGRMLAECEAKRRLLDLHKMVTEDYSREWWAERSKPAGTYVTTGCDNCRTAGVDGEDYLEDGPCETLRLLALPYADHADYDEAWRP